MLLHPFPAIVYADTFNQSFVLGIIMSHLDKKY